MQKVVGLLATLVFTTTAQADTSSTSETKNLKSYGNCHTATGIDLFTDAESHLMVCRESTFTDETTIAIFFDSGRLAVAVGKGLQFHLDDQVPVTIRIDKGEIIHRSAWWNPHQPTGARIEDPTLARQLLHDLARGQRVIIKVGDEGGNIRLTGSARAIQDFRQRSSLDHPQTLTIPE